MFFLLDIGGVHFAVQLKEAGFTNVHIVESTANVGGKCVTRFLDGIPYELGFLGTTLSEGENSLQKLVEKYGLKEKEVVVSESIQGEKTRSALKMNRFDSDIGDDVNDEEDTPHIEEYKKSISNLSTQIRKASFSTLPPFRRALTRRFSDIKVQVSQFFGKEPLVDAAKR